jgi:hypothetical protein
MRKGDLSLKEAYLGILQQRADMMGVDIDLKENDFLTKSGMEKITQLRFACLLRMSTKEDFTLLQQCFTYLGTKNKNNLIEMFGRSGVDGKLSVLFYYAPALMCEIRETEEKEDPQTGSRFGIEKGLRLMSKIASETKKHLNAIGLEPDPLYIDARTGRPVTFDEVIEIRGANMDGKGKIVEYVLALTQIVKANAQKLVLMPIDEGESETLLID